ncbi:hypothetical protein SFC65_19225 [Priestia filamentosa]|uniref:hypothetical protein n=1 Tax=Priestia filamentosa TaxID=1402861 RepID=UPI0039821C79
MGYLHRWIFDDEKLRNNFFPKSFMKDVLEILSDHLDILELIKVDVSCLQFNGKEGYGFETFTFTSRGRGDCKTGGLFSVEEYDIVVTSVLLLAVFHLNAELNCNGLATVFVNKETLEVSSYFEKALSYIEEKFGYTYSRQLYIDEYDQERIRLIAIPLEAENDVKSEV